MRIRLAPIEESGPVVGTAITRSETAESNRPSTLLRQQGKKEPHKMHEPRNGTGSAAHIIGVPHTAAWYTKEALGNVVRRRDTKRPRMPAPTAHTVRAKAG